MPNFSVHLTEWDECRPEPGNVLHKIHLDPDPAVQQAARDMSKQGLLEVSDLREGLLLRSTSYVGRLRLGEIEVTVQPKIEGLPLLRLLQYTYGLGDLHLYAENAYAVGGETFQDLLIHQLVTEAKKLMSRGLHRQYTRSEQQLSSPRGRFNMRKLVTQSPTTTATLPCVYFPRLEDNVLNRVLLAGLRLASTITTDLLLRNRVQRLTGMLRDSVQSVSLNKELMHRVTREMNRLTYSYTPAVTLISLLVQGRGMSLDDTSPEIQVPGFLFDMNRFFQALLRRFLEENLDAYIVQSERRIKGMMAYMTDYNPQRRHAPSPRPDFVIMQGSKVVAMLDTKYRDLWETSLPRDMLYQLAIYALSKEAAGNSVILYPTVNSEAKEAKIEIRGPLQGGVRGIVTLRPVNLRELEGMVSRGASRAKVLQGREFAEQLIFGRVSSLS